MSIIVADAVEAMAIDAVQRPSRVVVLLAVILCPIPGAPRLPSCGGQQVPGCDKRLVRRNMKPARSEAPPRVCRRPLQNAGEPGDGYRRSSPLHGVGFNNPPSINNSTRLHRWASAKTGHMGFPQLIRTLGDVGCSTLKPQWMQSCLSAGAVVVCALCSHGLPGIDFETLPYRVARWIP